MNHRRSNPALIVTALAGACMAPANAQWTIINLHPRPATESFAVDVEGGQQVGWAYWTARFAPACGPAWATRGWT